MVCTFGVWPYLDSAGQVDGNEKDLRTAAAALTLSVNDHRLLTPSKFETAQQQIE